MSDNTEDLYKCEECGAKADGEILCRSCERERQKDFEEEENFCPECGDLMDSAFDELCAVCQRMLDEELDELDED